MMYTQTSCGVYSVFFIIFLLFLLSVNAFSAVQMQSLLSFAFTHTMTCSYQNANAFSGLHGSAVILTLLSPTSRFSRKRRGTTFRVHVERNRRHAESHFFLRPHLGPYKEYVSYDKSYKYTQVFILCLLHRASS